MLEDLNKNFRDISEENKSIEDNKLSASYIIILYYMTKHRNV